MKLRRLPVHLLGLRVHNLDLECVLWLNNEFFASQFRKNAKNNLKTTTRNFFPATLAVSPQTLV